MDENQIILIDKPANISSFGVVAKVRAHLRDEFGHKVKVGHTGTLDPFATGLLILLSGKMTKRSNEFLKKDKIYEAALKLGYTSTTGDPEGIIESYKAQQDISFENHKLGRTPLSISEKEISAVLQSFIGTITQIPPRYSAIKINGERAYKLARKGQDFEIPSREVEIYSIDILDYHYPDLTIRCHVSSGTYIRTLAEDIGAKLNTGAYLTSLRRLTIGNYNVTDAHPLSDFTQSSPKYTRI